jgi:Xaa-Pro aminopeptidase
MSTVSPREAVGARFAPAAMLHARARSFEAVDRIAAAIRPGLSEGDATALAQDILVGMGMERHWHPLIVRFGEGTVLKAGVSSDPARVLGERDIFFVDIGPVWDGHEGDAGDTFTVGDDPQMQACAGAARALWHDVAGRWRDDGLTGQALYAYAAERAQAMGWRLNHEMKGHRVSDFPHAIHKAGKLADFDQRPSSGLWILEIQIAHPTRPIGAFFEDLLVAGND